MKNNIKRCLESPNCYLDESAPELVDARVEIQLCGYDTRTTHFST